MNKKAHQKRKTGKPELQIIERYAVSVGGLPVLEKAHWVPSEDKRARMLPGSAGKWLLMGVECPLANTALFERFGVRDPATDYMRLEIPDDSEYWDYYACPIKAGFQIVDRPEFLAHLATWNAALDAGDLTAWNAVQEASFAEYQRLIQAGWTEQLALTLSGYLKPSEIVEV